MNEQLHFEDQVAAAAATTRRLTQRELVLAELLKRAHEWVPMPDLVRASGAYAVHSRVADLRNAKWGGWKIDHRNVWRDGVCCSSYRLDITQPAVHSD